MKKEFIDIKLFSVAYFFFKTFILHKYFKTLRKMYDNLWKLQDGSQLGKKMLLTFMASTYPEIINYRHTK